MDNDPPMRVAQLSNTHVYVCEVEAETIGEVYNKMQAERWPSISAANDLIESLGLTHVSMGIGDVIHEHGGKYHECRTLGWRELVEG